MGKMRQVSVGEGDELWGALGGELVWANSGVNLR